MECIEARALKSSFLSELGNKSTQQTLFEDLWCVAGISNVVNVSSDEFSVDDLLDLSDKDFHNSGGDSFEYYSEEDFVSISSQDNDNNSINFSNFSSSGDLMALPAGELPVPVDDMENLEWLSNIVDDSVSELSLLCPPANLKEKTGDFVVNRFEPVGRLAVQSFTAGLPYSVPRKCRTKRSKKAGRVWSTGSLSLSESSSCDSSTSSMFFMSPVEFTEPFVKYERPPAKKQKKNPVQKTTSSSSASPTQNRCTHCQVQKTPQWRTGPLGPKTLCNACGVRFKSGRLFPEYRPACSPTFSGEVHSNSHRKVLEMRKKKETAVVEPGLNMVVQSF